MVALMSSRHGKTHSRDQSKANGTGVAERLRKGAAGLKEDVSEKFGQVREAVKGEANRLVDQQKGDAARKIKNLGSAIGKAGKLLHAGKIDGIAQYVDMAASGTKQVSSYLEENDLGEILSDAGKLAARHPIAVFGTIMIVGVAAGRFVKAAGGSEA